MKHTGKYVIFRESRDDFLHESREGKDECRTGWCAHPRGALTYDSRDEATRIAQRLADRKNCKLVVCELAESESQIALADPLEVWPVLIPGIN
jgi:hypothetical protein